MPSSVIRRFSYDEPHRRLRVTFTSGDVYDYADVPPEVESAFRAAFSVQYLFWGIGLVGVVRHRTQLRARLARDGVVLAPLHVAVGARLRGGSAYR